MGLKLGYYRSNYSAPRLLISRFPTLKKRKVNNIIFKRGVKSSIRCSLYSWVHLYICILIFLSNFIGLMPYIFTCTSHLSMTLTLSLPLWLGRILISILLQYNSLIAHLVPSGTPGFLIPIIVIIETVRNIIRPATLAIRLAANMVAGHLLLTLLGSQGPNLAFVGLIGLVIALILLLLLEVAVACIQSYVFTILSSLYLGELTTPGFTLKITK